jgi:hypothetical protein
MAQTIKAGAILRAGLNCFRSDDPRRLPVADAVMVMHRADLVVVVVREGRGRRGREERERGDGESCDKGVLHGGFLWMMPG